MDQAKQEEDRRERSEHRGSRCRATRSPTRASRSYRTERTPSVRAPTASIRRGSSGSHHSAAHSEKRSPRSESAEDEEVVSDGGDGQYKMNDLRKALEKLKQDKRSHDGLAITSPFTRQVRDSPLPRNYRGTEDLKFDGTVDPVEYVSRFNTEMEVYQIKDLTKCRLLAATLRAHKWFKSLPTNSIKSWKQMAELFVTQFRATVAYAPPVNTLANIKQRDDETLRDYF